MKVKLFIFTLVLVVSLCVFGSQALAGDFSWSGSATGGSWTDSGNWTLDSGTDDGSNNYPDGTDNATFGVMVYGGVTGTISCNNLVVNNLVVFGNTGGAADVVNVSGTNQMVLADGSSGFNISGNFSVSSLNSGDATITFDGGGAQSISSGVTFNNLTVNKGGGTLTFSASPTISNDFTITAGTVEIASGNTVTLSKASVNVDISGDFSSTTSQGILRFTNSDATIQLKTSGAKNLPGLAVAGGDVTIDGWGLDHTVTINGNVTCSDGIISFADGQSSQLQYSSGKTLTYSNSATLTAGKEWPTGSTNLPDDITFSNSATVTVNAARELPTGGIMTLSGGADPLLTVDGINLTINGTVEHTKSDNQAAVGEVNSGDFQYAAGSALKYLANAATTVGEEWCTTNASTYPPAVTLDIGSNTLTATKDLTVAGDFTYTSGDIDGHDNLYVEGDITGVGGTIDDATTLQLTGTSAATIYADITLNDLTINKTGADPNDIVTRSGDVLFTAGGTLTITDGVLDLVNAAGFSSGNEPSTISIGSSGALSTRGTDITKATGNVNTISAASGTIVFSQNGALRATENLPMDSSVGGNVTSGIGTVKITNPDGVKTTGLLTINDELIFTSAGGILETAQSKEIRIADNFTGVTGADATHYVQGPMQKALSSGGDTSFEFPIADLLDGAYRPATIAGISASITLEVEYSRGAFSAGTLPSGISEIDGQSHYVVSLISGTFSGSYDFTGYYEDGNFSPESRNHLLVQNGTDPNWSDEGGTVTEGDNTVAASGISALPTDDGYIAFGSGSMTVNWGGGSGSWNTAANWTQNTVPTSVDDVVIGSGTVNIDGSISAEANTITMTGGTLNLNSTSTTPLKLFEDDGSISLIVQTGAKLVVVDNTYGIKFDNDLYNEARTDFQSGSTVEYQDGSFPVDTYSNFIINGATGVSGSGTVTIGGNLEKKNASVAFSTANTVNVTGTYTNTAGNASYTTGLSVTGNTTLTDGVVGGVIGVQSNVTVDGGSFSGTVTFSGAGQQTLAGTAGTASFVDVVINNSFGVVLNPINMEITGNLDLTDGDITNNASEYVHLKGSSASVSNGDVSSMVVCPLRRDFSATNDELIYPVGDGASYWPAWFEWTSGTGINSTIEIEAQAGNPGGTTPIGISAIDGNNYYIVQEVGTTSGSQYSYTGTYTNGNVSPETRNRVLVQNGSNPNYSLANTDPSVDINTTNNTVTGNDITALPTDNNYIAFGYADLTGVRYWVGTSSTWAINGNWSSTSGGAGGATYPLSGNDVIIDGGTAQPTFSGTGGAKSVVIKNGKNLTITSNLTIDDVTGTPLTVESGGQITFNGGTVLFNYGTPAYDKNRTDFQTNSTVEYAAGNIEADTYYDLVTFNNSSTVGANGTGTIQVDNDLFVTGTSPVDIKNNGANAVIVANDFTQSAGNCVFADFTVEGANYAQTGTGSGDITADNLTIGSTNFVNSNFGGTNTVVNTKLTFTGGGAQSINTMPNGSYNLAITKTAGTTVSITPSVSVTNYTNSSGNATFNGTPGIAVSGNTIISSGTITGSNGININGSLDMDGGTLAGPVTFAGVALQTITGDAVNLPSITINNASNVQYSNNVTVTGNITESSGNFVANGTRTLTLAGGVLQTIDTGSFSNVVVNNSNNVTFSNAATIGGTYTNSAGTATFSGGATITGNTTLSGGEVAGTVGLNGNLTTNGGFFSGAATLGTGAQTQTIDGTAAADFSGGLTVNNASLTCDNVVTVGGTYTHSAGTGNYNAGLTFVGGTFNHNGGTINGTVSFGDGSRSSNSGSKSRTVNNARGGRAQQTIAGTAAPVIFENLTINNSDGVLVSGTNVDVTGTLTMTSGVLDNSGANTLQVAATSGGNSTSYVEGPLSITSCTGSHRFPIGTSGAYRPVTTNLTSAGSPTVQFQVVYDTPGPSDDGTDHDGSLHHIAFGSGAKVWTMGVSSANLNGGTVNLTYGEDDQVEDAADLRVAYSPDDGANSYTDQGGTGSGVPSGNITSDDVGSLTTGNSPFYFTLGSATADNPLPVDLVDFRAEFKDKKVVLTWATASEYKNAGFHILRSKTDDPATFEQINLDLIPGAGSSSDLHEYSFVDTDIEPYTMYYYKLVDVEEESFNEIVHITITVVTGSLEDDEIDIPHYYVSQNYPNPFNPETTIEFGVAPEEGVENEHVRLYIYDLNGKLIKKLVDRTMDAGSYDVIWDGTNDSGKPVPSGVYLYRLNSGNRYEEMKRMIMLK